MLLELDSEEYYDATYLEYTTDCTAPFTNWQMLDGGYDDWDDRKGPFLAGGSYPVTEIRSKFAFGSGPTGDSPTRTETTTATRVLSSSTTWSSRDSRSRTSGEALNTTETQDWEADIVPGYGASYMDLFPGSRWCSRTRVRRT